MPGFSDVMGLLSTAATVGGGLWLIWGVIVLAGGLKDKSGPALQSGIWQVIGGLLIVAAALWFKTVTWETEGMIEVVLSVGLFNS